MGSSNALILTVAERRKALDPVAVTSEAIAVE
jgi:hypothetical protein